MFVFLGSYSGGGGGGSSNDDSQDEESTDDHTQAGVDDYTGDGGDGGSGEDSGGGKAAAAGAAGAAGTAGAGGAGAAGTAASGAGGGAVTEPSEGDDSGDANEPDDEECEDEEENQRESPDVEESDIEPEDDVDESEMEEDTEEEDADEEDEDEEDEDEEDEVLVVVQEVDALSALSWGVQPVMKRVEECYGEEIELFYKPAPVREINPEKAKQKWVESSEELEMPVDPSFWDNHPPESTERVNKAFKAAIQQYRGTEYIRAMWRRGVAAGRDINDRETLIELASDLGLDPEQFEDDLDEVALETGERGELPFTLMEIQGNPVPKSGRLRYSDFKIQFTFQGIEEQEPQELQGFVDEHGPVATPEVMEVYGIQREEAVRRLEDLDDVSSFGVSGENFWY